MRHLLHIATIIASGIVATALGCTSSVNVDVWEQDRISQAHTWAFLKHDPPIQLPADETSPAFTYRVTSPERDAQDLDAELAHCIEQALAAQGFERVEIDADLYVDYRLTLQPRIDMIEVPLGERFLPSLSYTQSYIIEGVDISPRAFEALHLEIDLRERRGKILWRGELAREIAAHDTLALGRDVDNLIGRLPKAPER